MDTIKSIAFIFIVGSTGGWVLEFFYRHFVPSIGQTKKWVNPGFLSGPWLPLYGTGLSCLYLMSFITFPGMDPEGWGTKVLVLLIMVVAMTIIEIGAEYAKAYIDGTITSRNDSEQLAKMFTDKIEGAKVLKLFAPRSMR